MTRLDKDLAALATMSPALLRERWAAIGSDSTPNVPTGLMRRLLAQHVWEVGRHPRLCLTDDEAIGETAGVKAVQCRQAIRPFAVKRQAAHAADLHA